MSRRRRLTATQRATLLRALGHEVSWSVTVESLVKRQLMTSSSVLILPLHACKLYRLTKRGINVAVQLVTTNYIDLI